MRLWLATLLLMLAAEAAPAAEWRVYDNAAFGYAVEVPPDFEIAEEDAARLVLTDGPRRLEIFGLDLAPLGFEQAVALAMQSSVDEGFAIGAQSVTPRWARWTGVDGARQLAVGVVALCGTALAGYELRYQEADGVAMQAIIDRLQVSLRKTADC